MDWLRQRTAVTPHKLAFIVGKRQWTYAELDRQTDRVCQQLLDAGVEAGQLTAVLMPSSFLYVALIHALGRLGVTLVPLNGRLTHPELAWQLEHTEAPWLICDANEAERSEALARDVGCEVLNLELSLPDNSQQSTVNSQQSTINEPIHNPRSPAPNPQTPAPDPQPPTPQAIVFTSGTTGHPKGVELTFDNHFWSATASAYRLGVDPTDRWISCLPLYHVGGLAVIFRSCLYGTAVILHPRFDLNAINHSLDAQGGTLISVVPTMLYRLIQSRTHWPATLRLILVGGAAAEPELVEAANKLTIDHRQLTIDNLTVNSQQSTNNSQFRTTVGRLCNSQFTIVSTTYGLTEAASQVATQTPADTAKKPGSVGKPLMFTQVRIVDSNGRSLPPNQIGEIVIAGPTVMRGYFKNPDATAKTLKDGELHSGDMGYLDEDGDLWLVQRRSDIIISGGENVYPAEVEKVLKAHPAVANVCVVGIPDPEWGQVVTALVALHEDGGVTAEELEEYGRRHLAGYKQPRHIRFTDALPLTASGKIHRQAVKEMMTS